jgi:hypothetical protein
MYRPVLVCGPVCGVGISRHGAQRDIWSEEEWGHRGVQTNSLQSSVTVCRRFISSRDLLFACFPVNIHSNNEYFSVFVKSFLHVLLAQS